MKECCKKCISKHRLPDCHMKHYCSYFENEHVKQRKE